MIRSTGKNGPFSVIADQVAGLAFTDKGLANDTAYYYAVAAHNDKGLSYHSLPVKAVPGAVLTVAKDGSGQFTTIADAVNAVPDNSTKLTIIKVKNGIYNEKVLVPFDEKNDHDDRGKPGRKLFWSMEIPQARSVLTDSRSVQATAIR